MKKIHKARLHVVLIFGSVCPQFAFSASDISVAIGGNAISISRSWLKDLSADKGYWELIDDQQNLASLGRDIAISTGWDDEPVIPIMIEPLSGHSPMTVERLTFAINEVIAHARHWGADFTGCFHSLSIGESDLQNKAFLNDLRRQVGGDLRGEIDPRASPGLHRMVECNLWIHSIEPMVRNLVVKAGFLLGHERAVEQAVLGVVSRIRQSGFDICMDHEHLNEDVACKLANAILRDANWEL